MELLGFLGAVAIAFVIAKVIFSSKANACIHRAAGRQERRRQLIYRPDVEHVGRSTDCVQHSCWNCRSTSACLLSLRSVGIEGQKGWYQRFFKLDAPPD